MTMLTTDARPAPPDTRDPDTEALLRLAGCSGSKGIRRLLELAGPAAALAAGPALWRSCGLTRLQQARLHCPDAALMERGRHWLAAPGRQLLGWHDPDYPPLLRRGPNPPAVLFVDGDPALLWRPAVAVVGSRAPSPGGLETARELAAALARAGLVVASGMAAGIDTAAHQAALAVGGGSYAVLGTGPDVPYPHRNAGLHERLVRQGAVVSEHPPGTGPRSSHFPSRNRILAALGIATVVVEAAQRSGALITARLAGECGREVMAYPGSIRNPAVRGCHRLIRDGAALVEGPGEVLELVAPVAARLAADLRVRLDAPICGEAGDVAAPAAPAPSHNPLWQALGHDPSSMDQLIVRSGLTPTEVSSMLLALELEGRVAARHGRWYRTG
ncbi:DNA-processing protein DprA [Lysobacter sp. GX 14042]|uniref:DNA-processing protein DprA n=1 Tax=Lysobacter sp. GX 14042 TaxID=2907155 RepID=UPI0031B9DE63